MTVLFGENGAGKSGYVRILKRLAAVRSAEEILPNIHDPAAKGSPSATIEYTLGKNRDSEDWTGQAGVRPLTRMSVFDARAVNLHLEGDLTYVYTPRDLALFKHVHEAIEGVRDRLHQTCQDTRPGRNQFLDRFDRESTIYAKIETLDATTNLAELETLANVSEEDEATLDSLRTTVEALRSDTLGTRLQVAQSDAALIESIQATAKTLADFDWDAYNRSLGKHREADEHLANATQTAFAAESIPGVLSPTWQAFIQAADAHWKDLGNPEYHTDQDTCIYCQQDLGDTARQLLAKYHEFCNNTYRSERDVAWTELETLAAALTSLDAERLKASIAQKLSTLEDAAAAPPVLSKAQELLAGLEPILTKVAARSDVDPAVLTTLANELQPIASTLLTETQGLVPTLKQQGKEREETLATESSKLRELESRITLKQLLPQIKTHVENAKWASRADTVLSTRIRSLLQSLTTSSKTASEQLLNQGFSTQFAAECTELAAPKVKLEFPGRRGEAARRKSLARNTRLSDILSEGEQKVIALADFLAESSIRTTSAPLVFDDPVNSLDYRRLQYIVDRLFTLSQDHQVIVFTHNIWFAMALLAKFDKLKDQCAYYDVTIGTGEIPGIVSGGQHPRYDTPSQLRARINELVQNAKSQTGETQQALIETAYSRFRSWCEVAVEQELLAGVTLRYQPNVRMTVAPQIKADRLDAAFEVILPLFEKACRITEAHSQPLETLNVRPTIDELEADWKAAQDALAAYKA